MNRKHFALAIFVFVGSSCCFAADDKPVDPAQSSELSPIDDATRSGLRLFKHQWTKGDSMSEMGDGLGPVFNGRSCVQCHYQAGAGGGGSNEQNVDILSVQIPPITDAIRRREFVEELTSLHRGFAMPAGGATPSITLHTHGTNQDYYKRRKQLLERVVSKTDDEKELREVVKDLVGDDLLATAIEFQHTQRNTPALFGAGLLDEISEKVLERTRKQSTRRYPQVTGRIARIETPALLPNGSRRNAKRPRSKLAVAGSSRGRVGKFGWRGQISTLEEFVRGACANEIGLAVSTQPQPVDPVDADPNSIGLDLTDRQCRELTSYVASLPAPKPVLPVREDARKLAAHGRVIFGQVGCDACHVERMGSVEFVYSDLLLHDMGDELSDPLPAPSETSVTSSGPGYYGTNQPIFSSTPLSQTTREWRTAPLWGVADSAPYMHDGRAETLADAILAHGGEAEFTVINYVKSSVRDQLALLSFLQTLRAPNAVQPRSVTQIATKQRSNG